MHASSQTRLLSQSCSVFVTRRNSDRAVTKPWLADFEIVWSENRVGDYTPEVARGWESKSVEAQQAEAGEKPVRLRPPMTAEQAARCREKENLRLARQRVLQQIEASSNPRLRNLLADTLADLEQKLSRF